MSSKKRKLNTMRTHGKRRTKIDLKNLKTICKLISYILFLLAELYPPFPFVPHSTEIVVSRHTS